jgi:hypothetical protein
MNIRRFARQFGPSMIGLALLGVCPMASLAQSGHSHTITAQNQQLSAAQSELLKTVRQSTAKYKDVAAAKADGYALLFGCVSGPDYGAMGLHYVNLDLVASGVIDATRPQIVIYEPTPGGGLQLVGADFLVIASDWDKGHPGQGAPQLMGQLFHYFESPNRFGLPAFYTLHVWAWKKSPSGAFVNWHPNVSCQSYAGQ